MSAQPAYLSSIFVSFSTFLAERQISGATAHDAQLALGTILEHKTDWSNWDTQRLAGFWQTPAGLQHTSNAQALATAFIRRHPPTQINVFLHEFALALKDSGCSHSTIKNYRSDISQFAQFAKESELSQLITKPKVVAFLRQQRSAGLKHSSIRRKLVSLQQFAQWATGLGIIPGQNWFPKLFAALENAQPLEVLDATTSRPKPADSLQTRAIAPVPVAKTKATFSVLDSTSAATDSPRTHQERTAQLQSVFSRVARKHLRRPQFGNNPGQWALTVLVLLISLVGIGFFGYQQFILRVSTPFAYPSSPVRPNRQLSFQGRLTDTAQNPVTAATDMRFYLFDTGPATGGGTELWDSGTCSVTPDQDGIFSVGLGDDCGAEITEDVFSENSNVWLEVEIETETLDPRQAIQTVPYALNSETLQGYPITASGAATVNTVVTMNAGGEVVLGEVSPTIRSVSGTFSLEAQTLSLETSSGSNGDIILSPDGTGQVEINADTVIDGYLYAPGATLSATYAGGIPLSVKAGPSATANITEWQNSSGTALTVVDESGNIGISSTNPAYKLDVNGTARLSSTTTIGTNGYLQYSSGRLELISGSGGQIALYTDSAERLRIAVGGNVGIGSATPGEKLDVVGNFKLTGTTTFNTIAYTWPASQASGYVLSTNGSGTLSWSDPAVLAGGTNLWDTASGALYPKNSTLDLLVGGTATSSAKFALINVNSGNPTATISGNLALAVPTGADPATTLDVFNGGSLNVRTSVGGSAGATSRLFLNNNGDIGVGTTNPIFKFQVDSTDASDGISLRTGGTELARLRNNSNTSGDLILLSSGSTKTFITGSTSDSYLNNGGNLGIGTSSPGGKLQINGGGTGVKSLLVRGNTSDDANIQEWQLNAGTNQMYVNQYGELYIGAGAVRDATVTPKLYIGKAESSDISYSAASETVIQVTGAASGVYGNSFYGYISPTTGKTVAEAHGMMTQANKGGLGNVTELTAYNARLTGGTGGTLSNLYGFNIDYSVNSGAAITNSYGLHVPEMTVSSGSLTNQYGIYLDSITSGTNDFAIVTNAGNIVFNEGGDSSTDFRVEGDTDANLLFVDASADNVGIGTSAPSQQLDVAGEIELANYLYFGNGSSNYLRWDATNFQISNTLLPITDATYSLGSDSNRWQDLYLSGSSLHMGTSGDEAILGYSTASDYLSFDPDADAVAEVVISDAGNLGIGSLTPAAALDVVGDVYISSGLSTFNTAVSDDTIEATTFCTGDGESNCVSDFSVLSGGSSIWATANGAIYPTNSTRDLLIGATATTSAKFAFTNVDSGTPTASISAGTAGAAYLNSQGKLATTAMQNLTLGDSTTTGDVIINPNRNVGIGTTTAAQKLDVAGKIAINGAQVVYRPDQTSFTGSLIYGNGGGSLSHGSGSEGFYNTAIGIDAGNGLSTAAGNTMLGYRAGYATSTTGRNVYLGYTAGSANTTGSENVFIGHSTGDDSTAATATVLIGYGAGATSFVGNSSVIIGHEAFTTGTDSTNNVFIGRAAGKVNAGGTQDVFIGRDSGFSNTTGDSSTYIGAYSGRSNTTGDYNTYLGHSANYYNETGNYNVMIGYQAGYVGSLHNKSGNIFIGYQAGYSESGSDKLYIENSNSTSPLVYGDFSGNTVTINGNFGIGDASPSQAFTVGSGDLFQVNSSGELVTIDGVAHTITDSAGDVSINSNGGSLLLADTDTLVVGGLAGAAYNAFSDSGTTSHSLASDNDLFVEGDFEVDGTSYLDGAIDSNGDVSIADTNISLDGASTTFTQTTGAISFAPAAGSNFNISLSTTGDFVVNTNDLYVDTSAGNIGIGTTAPSKALHILGSDSTTDGLLITESAGNYGGQIIATNSFGNNGGLIIQGRGITGRSGITILSDTNKSINLAPGRNAVGSLLPTQESTTYLVAADGSTDILRWTNSSGTTLGVINNSGNFGIGSTGPTQALDVVGNFKLTGTTTLNSLTYTWPASQTNNYVLSTNGSGTLSWTDPNTLITTGDDWDIANGSLYPKNSTVDLLVGGTATTSAKFAVLNVNTGTPTASVSAGTAGAAYLNATGKLATTAMQNITIGDSTTTGDVIISPNRNIGIGTTAPGFKLSVPTTSTTAIQYGTAGYLTSLATTAMDVTFGAAYNGSNWVNSGAAGNAPVRSSYSTSGLQMFTGSAGANGSTVTWTERLRLSATGGLALGSSYVGTDPGAANLIVSGNIGIGTTNPSAPLHVSTSAGNSTIGAIYASYTSSYTGGSSQSAGSFSVQGLDSASSAYMGLSGNAQTGNGTTYTLSGLVGVQGSAVYQGTGGTLSNANSVTAGLYNSGAGTITYGTAFNANMYVSGAGNIAVGHGFRLQTVSDTGGGSFQTLYGMYLTAITAATSNNYGIWGEAGDWILDENGDGAAGGTTGGGNIILGELQDLELYHDGTNSYIMNNTGDLYIGDAATDDVILSNNGGNVGITTTNPTAKLHIVGGNGVTARVDTTAAGNVAKFELSEAGTSKWQFSNFGSSNDILVISGDGGLGVDDFLTINQTGNVGIGDTSPTYLLDVAGTGRFTGAVDLDADLELNSTLTDVNGSVGTSGQILSSTATGVDWIDAPSSGFTSWTIADDDTDTYSIVDGNILRFTSSDSNILTNLANGDDGDENMDFSVRLLGDAVAGTGLTGGSDNVLVGADADVTFNIGAGNGITVNADDVAVDQTYNFSWTGTHSWSNTADFNGNVSIADTNISLDGASTTFTQTTGAISFAPAAGTNLNVTLSTTGDFIVNTNDLVVDTSSGNIGIGSTTPGAALDVVGDIYVSSGLSTFNTGVSDDTIEATRFCTGDGETNCVTDFSALPTLSGWTDDGPTVRLTTAADFVSIGSATNDGKVGIDGARVGQALLMLNEEGDQNIWTASASGTTVAHLARTGYLTAERFVDISNSNYYVDPAAAATSMLTAGNVGIGTTTASQFLHVSSGTTDSIATFRSSDDTGRIDVQDNDSTTYLGAKDSYGFLGGTNTLSTSNLNIDLSTGNIGLGTTAPLAKMHITGANAAAATGTSPNGSLMVNNGDVYLTAGIEGNAPYAWLQSRNGTAAAYYSLMLNPNGGNVGIGTTTASQMLHVNSSTTDTVATFRSSDDTARIDIQDNDTTVYALAKDSYLSLGGTSSLATTNLNIHTTTGNTGIGDTSPDALLDFDFSSTSSSAGTEYGGFFTFSDTGNVSTGTDTGYGLNISYTRTGASGGTINSYGLNISATGDSGGTSTLTGLNVSVASADTNYAATFSGGNVGVGTTTPGQSLDVAGQIELANYLYFGNAATEYLRWDGSSSFILTDDFVPSGSGYGLGSFSAYWGTAFLSALDISDGGGNAGVIQPLASDMLSFGEFATYDFKDTGLQSFTTLSAPPAAGASGTVLNIKPALTAMNGSDTVSLLGINASNADHTTGSNFLYGINVAGITADAEATEVGIFVDTGWDISAIFSGNVGIGDSTPDAKLELLSTTEQLRLTHTDGVDETNFTVDTDGNLTINNSGTKTMFSDDVQITGNDILDSSATTRISLGATTTLTNTTTTLSGTTTLTASSLATITSSSALSLGGATSLTFTADDATVYGSDSANGDLTLHGTSNATRTTSYVLIQPTAGNVGIGTTAPAATLDIQGPMVTDGSLSFQSILANDTTAYNSNPVAGQMFYNIYTSGGSFAGMGGITVGKENTTDGNYSSYLALHTRTNGSSVAERLRINSAGNVGIGSTSPAYKFDVATDIADYAAKIFNDGNSTSRTGLIIQVGADSGSGTNTAVRFNDGDGTQAGQITFTGTTMTYGSASDVRLKENITVSNRGLADLMQIQVADFNFKIDESKHRWTGFLAQQLYEHFPDAVAVPNNPDDQWNVDYGKVTPLIVKSIQEQQQIIEQQQVQLADITQDLGAVSLDSTGQVTLSNQNGEYIATAVSSGSVLTNISAFAQTITANATAGLTTTRELIVQQSAQIANLSTDSITIAGQSLRDFVAGVVRDTVQQEDLVSPLAQVTLDEDESFTVTNPSGATIASIDATGKTKLGELVVTGDATVAGTLSSARLTALGELTAGSASISGELVAETVTAATISAESVRLATLEGRMAEFESIKAQTADLVNATVSGTLYANNIDGFESKVAAAFDEPSLLEILLQKTGQAPAATESAEPGNLADLHETISTVGIDASSSAELNLSLEDLELTTDDATLTASAAFINDYLKINGSAYINNSLAVRQNLFVGEGMHIADGLIEYTTAPGESQILAIQPSGKGTLSLLAGLMELNENGQVNITGNLAVAGNVRVEGSLLSNLLQPAEYGNPFQVQVAGIATESGQVKESRFEIVNELGAPVATISAQGRAAFAGGIGIGSESLGAPASESDTVTANKTSGKAAIAANIKEVIIKSEHLTGNSLIYVTPVGSTENKVLYVKSQTAENKETGEKEGQFVVGFDEAVGKEVQFNWWVVN